MHHSHAGMALWHEVSQNTTSLKGLLNYFPWLSHRSIHNDITKSKNKLKEGLKNFMKFFRRLYYIQPLHPLNVTIISITPTIFFFCVCGAKMSRENTLTASTGSEELRSLANEKHSPSTSDKVFTCAIASCGFIPSFMPRTI